MSCFPHKTRAPARNADPSRMICLQDMVTGEYDLDVLGINLQGGEKTSKKTFALVTPKQRGGQKMKIPSLYQGPGVRDQLAARYHADLFRPNWSKSDHFCGPNQAKLPRNVAEPMLAPEKRSRGIRWGNLHHFSRSIWSQPPGLQKIERKKKAFPLLPIR